MQGFRTAAGDLKAVQARAPLPQRTPVRLASLETRARALPRATETRTAETRTAVVRTEVTRAAARPPMVARVPMVARAMGVAQVALRPHARPTTSCAWAVAIAAPAYATGRPILVRPY